MSALDPTLTLLEESMHDMELMEGDTGQWIAESLEKSPAAHNPKLFALIKKIDKDSRLSERMNDLGIRQLLYAKMAFSPQLNATLDRLCASLSDKLQQRRNEWATLSAQERVLDINGDVVASYSEIDPNCLDDNLVEEQEYVVFEGEEAYPGYEGFADPDTGQLHLLTPEDDPELGDFENTHNLTVHEFAHGVNAVLGAKRRLYGWADENEMTELDYKMNEYFWREDADTDEMHAGKYINPVEAIARQKEAQWSLSGGASAPSGPALKPA